MANTINDLYLKYVNKVGKSLENDRYFQYLFEMIQAGRNELKQTHQIMHKIVDEKWLTTIEDSLDSIYKIIDKPRRFIATDAELVPVALAKKITADSVIHLSQNTQFIASDENGEVQPTKVLNVTTKESFDLYENRFIFHLIQRLVSFIDRRTDVIFWQTGDETRNVLTINSSIDDAYEQIDYKLELTIKNCQSYEESEADHMQLFMRIDRVRRMVHNLKQSSFCKLMFGCQKVASPIQRTNLIMKDPHYRKCYQLWKFLESYDDVGYSIEVEDRALEFDEEYLIQMYVNLITNYTVFKSLTEADMRDILETQPKKRRHIKPKFIKTIQEEEVPNRDIPYVEVKRVFVEEVTEGQVAAEKRVEELEAEKKDLQQEIADLEERIEFLTGQMNAAIQNSVESARNADEAERQFAEYKAKTEGSIKAAEDRAAEAESRLSIAVAETETKIAESVAAAEAAMAERVAEAEGKMNEAVEKFAVESAEKNDLQKKLAAETDGREKAEASLKTVSDDYKELKRNHAKTVKEAESVVEKLRKAESSLTQGKEDLKKALSENTELQKAQTLLRREYDKYLKAKKNAEEKFQRSDEARRELDKKLNASERSNEKMLARIQKIEQLAKSEAEARKKAESLSEEFSKKLDELTVENLKLEEKLKQNSLGKTLAGWIRGDNKK